jgi:arylsulfatase A
MLFTHQNRFGETRMTPGSVRTQQYRLVNRDSTYELYDMLKDPRQKTDIAAQHPAVTSRLASAYETWYLDVTARGTDAPPLPVGYTLSNPTVLQAEDAHLHGGLQFRRKQGWAHDSILNWRTDEDKVTWNIDVLQPGRYEIMLMIGAGASDVGTEVQIEVNGRRTQTEIHMAHDPMPIQDRAHKRSTVWTEGPVPMITWIPLDFEPVTMKRGRTDMVVRVNGASGTGCFELKEARVRLLK